jgi:PBP1b-binding outer membrane lipoprotein LpoB
MRKITLSAFALLFLFGCAGKKVQKQAVLDSILKVHDKVMNADDQLMKNQALLDSLLKQPKFAANDTAKAASIKLNAAENAMENWMHQFDPEQKGKSDDESVAYFHDQKRQIMTIDSQVNAAIAESNRYLKTIKGK